MAHVVVCGAGVIGLCCAFHLRARGHEVTLLERSSGPQGGCSFGNAGLIVPSHFIPLAAPGMVALGMKWMLNRRSPFYVRPRLDMDLIRWALRFAGAANAAHVARSAPMLRDLHLASRTIYEGLGDRAGNDFGLVKRGLLVLCETRETLHEESQAAAQAQTLGIPAEVVSSVRAAELNPGLRMNIAGGVHYPLDCHMDPARFMRRLLELVTAAGVTFHWSAEITGWCASNDRIAAVRVAQQEIEADDFVLACGAWSQGLARMLGLRLPIQAGKGYSLTLTAPPRIPELCSILSEARVAVTPIGSSLRFGGTMELSGLDGSIRTERVQTIAQAATRYFPELRLEEFLNVKPWVGLRPCSPDGLPYIGRFARYPNLCAATGHAMMGMSLGPVTGRLVAEIVSGEVPSLDIGALSPNRYA